MARATVSKEQAEEELAVRLIEKQIEEDERHAETVMAAAATVKQDIQAPTASAAQSEGEAKPTESGPGYMMIALQEQLMQLKAQIEAMQSTSGAQPSHHQDVVQEVEVVDSASVYSEACPPPVPERDDEFVLEEESSSALPAPPPPPTPFKTPLTRRLTVSLKTISPALNEVPEDAGLDAEENVDPAPATLTGLIAGKTKRKLKETGIPRSPGGTPARREVDHTSFLANALQSKFKSVRANESPAKNLSDCEEWETPAKK